jgi:hypothetical protein
MQRQLIIPEPMREGDRGGEIAGDVLHHNLSRSGRSSAPGLEAVLAWLKLQALAEVVLVEQDIAPTLGDLPAFPGLRSLFAYNPGPFNKSWGFNVGVRAG